MQDPIGSFERIRELYISYLDTAFRIHDPDVAAERRALLRTPGTLTTQPLVEPIPRYLPASHSNDEPVTFDDLFALTDPEKALEPLSIDARKAFVNLILAGLFPSKARAGDGHPLTRRGAHPPYAHQVRMLARGVRPTSPAIVTSGTGSGKTESFLMPVLAGILAEAVGWSAPEPGYLARPWWHDPATGKPYEITKRDGSVHEGLPKDKKPSITAPLTSAFEPHRTGEKRPAAVRAIVLYPMNALVEDQLVRLRRALDSREALAVMETELKGNRLFFGRYIGATPVTGPLGSATTPTGLDAFLLAGRPAAKAQGTIWFPDHKLSDPATGDLSLEAAWKDEYQRRKRRLEELFDDVVSRERAQQQARLHALDLQAQSLLEDRIAEHEKQSGLGSLTLAAFVQLARGCGKRTRNSLTKQAGDLLGNVDVTGLDTLSDLMLTIADADAAPSSSAQSDAAFMFPSVDGCEQSDRWDMQSHPPDILITNVSMLSAILNREVEDPLFEKTKEWLASDHNAYFYLVLDELHLQRGAAGTEVAYLLRLLLHRLGLTQPEHRHKLRVLASSASLPADADGGSDSSDYLWQMFGPNGLPREAVDATPEDRRKEFWRDAIIQGREMPSRYGQANPPVRLPSAPFARLLRSYRPDRVVDEAFPLAEPLFVHPPAIGTAQDEAWREVCQTLDTENSTLSASIAAAVVEVTHRLIWACWERSPGSSGGRTRAQPIDDLATALFGDLPDGPDGYAARTLAVRGLLLVRGAEDGMRGFLPPRVAQPPSFRLHTFFRSIEGLYAPAVRGAGSLSGFGGPDRKSMVGGLTIDQKAKIRFEERDIRVFDVLYCECCGATFFGGMRANTEAKTSQLRGWI